MVLAPKAGVKSSEAEFGSTGSDKAVNPKATVATELSRRGEHAINRKPIAWGMPDVSGASLSTRVRDGRFLHTGLRVLLGIPAFPAPSVF